MKRFIAGCAVCMMLLGTTGLVFAAEKKAAKAEQAPGVMTGKVLETMDSGGYTYAQIDNKGKKIWIAIPQAKVTKGKVMSFKPGMEMKNFESKTLKRKFDSIVFSDGIAQ